MEIGERIITDILAELQGRSGFDSFWDTVEAYIQEEIITTLWEIVDKQIEAYGGLAL